MTNKEKKAYLSRYKKIDNEINQLILERDEMMSLATKITPNYSDMPSSHSSGDKVQLSVERMMYYEAALNQKIDELYEIKTDIERAIHTVKDSNLMVLLRYRYINGCTWEDIALRMSYSYMHTCRLHAKALDLMML